MSSTTEDSQSFANTESPANSENLENPFKKHGYVFKNPELLKQALTHKSYRNENLKKSRADNERFEFLGDSVLDLSLSDHLMKRFPELTEGELSKIRASLVNESTLADLAKEWAIDKHLLLGKGEIISGGSAKPRLLASTLEAIIGALYLDSGFQAADQIIRKIFASRIDNLDLDIHFESDYKTRLQEKIQESMKQTPVYEIEGEEGLAHNKIFHMVLKLDGKIIARGSGRSKKQAEQDAARAALAAL
ncbi:MAG: ribonuclease III [Bdellovibrionales bacterium RBG_16_40_8]|nr:MAG: ribonuclease III [Bdellovibrionales bacterium RBG_16_40_8]